MGEENNGGFWSKLANFVKEFALSKTPGDVNWNKAIQIQKEQTDKRLKSPENYKNRLSNSYHSGYSGLNPWDRKEFDNKYRDKLSGMDDEEKDQYYKSRVFDNYYSDSADRVKNLKKQMDDYIKNPSKDTSLEELKQQYDIAKRDLGIWNSRHTMDADQRDIYVSRKIVEDYETNPYYNDAKQSSWTNIFSNPFEAPYLEAKKQDVQKAQDYLKDVSAGYSDSLFEEFLELDEEKKNNLVDEYDSLASSLSSAYSEYKGTDWLNLTREEKLKKLADFMALNEIGGSTAATRGLTEDINDTIEDNQTVLEKSANGIAKTVDSFSAGFLGVAGILYGLNKLPIEVAQWIASGYKDEVELNKIWNNGIVKYAANLMETDAWSPEEQERLKSLGLNDNPIFNTTEQNNSLVHANMAYEVVPNIGFTAASMGTSKLLSGAGQLISKGVGAAARLVSKANNVNSIMRGIKAAQTVAKVSDVLNPVIVGSGEGALNAYSTASETLKNLTEGAYNNYNNRITRSIEDYVLSNPERAYNFLVSKGYNLPVRTYREGEKLPELTSNEVATLLEIAKQDPTLKEYMGKQHNKSLQDDLRIAQEMAIDAGNRDFVGNSLVNGALNYTLKATLMAPSVQRRLQRYTNPDVNVRVPKNKTVDVSGKKVSYGASVRHGLKEMAGEGLEEYIQHISSTLGQSVSANSFEQYLDNKYKGGKSTEEARDIDLLNVWGAGIATTLNDMASLDALKEGLYGALGAAIGAPTIQSRYKIDANGNKVKQSPITWHSEFFKGISNKWAKERNGEINKSVKLLKEYFSNEKNRESLLDATTALNFMQQMESAAANKDEKETRDKELGLLVSNINMLNSLRGTEYYNTVIETLKARAEIDINDTEIDDVLRLQPSSKSNPMTRQEAQDAIKRSASKMLEYIEKTDKISQQVSKDYYGLNKDAKDALIYTRLAYENSKERLKTLRKELSLPSIEGGDTKLNNPTLEAIVRFGSRENAIRALVASKSKAESEIESLESEIKEIQADIKSVENDEVKSKLKSDLLKNKSKLAQLKSKRNADNAFLDKLSKQEESSDEIDTMTEEGLFTMEDILRLDEVTRAALFDRFKNGELDERTSAVMQKVISKHLNGDIANVNKVIDIGKLTISEREDGVTLAAMMSNPNLINFIVDAKKREASLDALNKRGEALNGIIINEGETSTQEYINALNSLSEDYKNMNDEERKVIDNYILQSIVHAANKNSSEDELKTIIATANKLFPELTNKAIRGSNGVANRLFDLELFGEDIEAIMNSMFDAGPLFTEPNAKVRKILMETRDNSYTLEELLSKLDEATDKEEDENVREKLLEIADKLEKLQEQRQIVKPKSTEGKSKDKSKDKPKKDKPKAPQDTRVTPPQQSITELEEVPIGEIIDEQTPSDLEDVPLDSPTLEEQIDDALKQGGDKPINIMPAPKQDLTDMGNIQSTPDSYVGNGMMEYSVDDLLTYGRQSKRKSANSSDPMELYFEWMDNFGVKLQEIIDSELNEIIKVQPNLRLMIVNDKNNSTKDSNMANRIILCVEYTEDVSKIHNESNGGIFISDGKRYLMVGSLTGKANNEVQKKWAKNYAKYHRDNGGKQFFEANPNERFYVIPNVYTTISHMNAGRITRQLIEDEHPVTRSIQELLEDPLRNPEKLELEDLKWAIIKDGEIATIGITSRDRVVYPIDKKSNMGNTFLMMKAANGIYIPVAIKAVHLNAINNGKLKDRIYSTIQKLLSPNYEERVEACKELSNLIAINESNNIFTDKEGNVKIIVNGTAIKTFNVNNQDISIQDLFNVIDYWNPRIQITVSDLSSASRLKELNDAGALSTDIAKLGTSGADYYINPIGSDGKPIEIAPPQMPGITEDNSAYVRKKEHSVLYKSKVYREINGIYYQDGLPVVDEQLLEQLKLNQVIESQELSPTEIKGEYEYYIISNDPENPVVYKRNIRTHEVKKFTTKGSKDYINKKRKEEENKKKIDNAKIALDEGKSNITELEDVDLGEELNDLAESFDKPINDMPQNETLEEQQPAVDQLSPVEGDNLKGGGTSIGELLEESDTTTLEGILASDTYSDDIMSIIEDKVDSGEWENFPDDINKITEYFKSKGIATTGITNVREWLNMIKECK